MWGVPWAAALATWAALGRRCYYSPFAVAALPLPFVAAAFLSLFPCFPSFPLPFPLRYTERRYTFRKKTIDNGINKAYYTIVGGGERIMEYAITQRPTIKATAAKNAERSHGNGKRGNMKYMVNLYNVGGDIIATETAAAAFVWENTANGGKRAVNTIYATAAAMVEHTPTAAAFRVYPLNDTALALRCATTAASVAANKGGKAASVDGKAAAAAWIEKEYVSVNGKNTAKKAGNATAAAIEKAGKATAAARSNATQAAIENDLRRINAALCERLANVGGGNYDTLETFVYTALATANAHTQDYFSVCIVAALETNGTPTEKAAAIYKAANAYTYKNKAAAARDVSTEWIIDGGGDIVSWGTAAAAILKGGERWTPTAAANMDTETAAALGVALAAAFSLLSPVQRDIVRRIVNGYSIRQTAAALGRGVATIQRNVDTIRKIYGEYITANAPQFTAIIETATAAANGNGEKARTAAAARREREKAGTANGKTATERMREYRERKKAAALAAANV